MADTVLRLCEGRSSEPSEEELLAAIARGGKDAVNYTTTTLGQRIVAKAKQKSDIISGVIDICTSDSSGRNLHSPLLIASAMGWVRTVNILLQNGADPDRYSEDLGLKPLHLACEKGKDTGVPMVTALLEHNADVNAENNYGGTPLFYSSAPEITELLLRAGAKSNKKYNLTGGCKGTVLMHLLKRKEVDGESIVLLLGHGADPDATITEGGKEESALAHVCSRIAQRDELSTGTFVALENVMWELLRCGATIRPGDDLSVMHCIENQKSKLATHIHKHQRIALLRCALKHGMHDAAINLLKPNEHEEQELGTGDLLSMGVNASFELDARDVLEDGPEALMFWISEKSAEARKVMKIVALGHGRAGKTTLLRTIQYGADGVHTPSTIGVNLFDLSWPGSPSDILFRAMDFAGQLQYHSVHSFFLSPYNSLFVIVVDLSLGEYMREEHVNYWVSYIENNTISEASTKFKSYLIQLVGTHVDKLGDDAILSCQNQLLRMYEKIGWHRCAGVPLMVSSIEEELGDGISAVKRRIIESARKVTQSWKNRLVDVACVQADLSLERLKTKGEEIPLFIPVSDLPDFLGAAERKGLNIAEYLHRIGSMSLSPSKEMVCTLPKLLGKIFAVFVCPDEHAKELGLGSRDGLRESSVIAESDAEEMIKSVLVQEEQPHERQHVVRCLEALVTWTFCVRITAGTLNQWDSSEESAIDALREVEKLCMFPALRPTASSFRIPSYRLHLPRPADAGGLRSSIEHQSTDVSDVDPIDDSEWVGAFTVNQMGAVSFSCVQASLCAYWHASHILYSNGVLLGLLAEATTSSGGESYCAVAGIVRRASGQVRVLVRALSEADGKALHGEIQRALITFGEYTDKDFDHWSSAIARQRIGDVFGTERMPWSWVDDASFLEDVDGKYWTRMNAKKVKELNLDPARITQHVYWTHLNDEQLSQLGMEYGPTVESARRCVQLTREQCDTLGIDYEQTKASLSDLEYTELWPEFETYHPRKKEVEFVKRQLVEFMGKQTMNEDLLVYKVVALRNTKLEIQFQRCYGELSERLEAQMALEDGEPIAEAVHPLGHDADRMLRDFTMKMLKKYRITDLGRPDLNLILAWNGAEERFLFHNALTGFRRLDLCTEEQLEDCSYVGPSGTPSIDMGWFGRGVYVTQFPYYGKVYARKLLDHAKSPVDGAAPSSPDASAHASMPRQLNPSEVYPLLLSYVLMGRVYPVIEQPRWRRLTLNGRPCKRGFDSHYVLVQGTDMNKLPVECDESGNVDEPSADEGVIFSPTQILPRYLVYCVPQDRMTPPSGKKNVTLWVDPNGEQCQDEWFRTMSSAAVELRIATCTAEAMAWMVRNRHILLRGDIHFRIMTNRYRRTDGGAQAGKMLIRRVRERREWGGVSILVYCGRIGPVLDLWAPSRRLYVTTLPCIAGKFAKHEKLIVPDLKRSIQDLIRPFNRFHRGSIFGRPPSCACENEFGWFSERGTTCSVCGNVFCSQCIVVLPDLNFRMCSGCRAEV